MTTTMNPSNQHQHQQTVPRVVTIKASGCTDVIQMDLPLPTTSSLLSSTISPPQEYPREYQILETIKSVYIPRIRSDFNIDDIHKQFMHIGKIDRIDLVPLEDEKISKYFYSAFVYVGEWFLDTEICQNIARDLAQPGGKGSYKLNINANNYWIICINHKPIANTSFNIHQLAEQNRLLQEQNRLLQERILNIETILGISIV